MTGDINVDFYGDSRPILLEHLENLKKLSNELETELKVRLEFKLQFLNYFFRPRRKPLTNCLLISVKRSRISVKIKQKRINLFTFDSFFCTKIDL